MNTKAQLDILLNGLERIHPEVAQRLRNSYEKNKQGLNAEDEQALTDNLTDVIRGLLIAEVHADPRYAGLGSF